MDKKLIITILCTTLLIISACFISDAVSFEVHKLHTSHNYYAEINEHKEDEKFKAKEAFVFDFEKAYIISDCSLNGNEINETYNLNLNIKQIEVEHNEDLRRILFVDKNGNYITDYCYNIKSEFTIIDEDIVIYPNTYMRIVDYKPSQTDTDSYPSGLIVCDIVNVKEAEHLKKRVNIN